MQVAPIVPTINFNSLSSFFILKKMKLFRYGRWIAASLGVASTTLVVTCATPDSMFAPKARIPATVLTPDFAPLLKWDVNWDRRDPRFLKFKIFKKAENETKEDGDTGKCGDKEDQLVHPKARRNIILVRHGQYNQNGNDDNCHTLTKLGEEQATLAGKRLKDLGIKFTSIVSSGMIRAIQTAEIIAKQIDQPGLKILHPREGPPCIPEPPASYYDPDFYEFFEHGARIEAAFRKYFHRADLDQTDDSYEIIVCHGNVIRYFSLRALQFPPEGWLRIGIDHTSLTKLSVLPEGDVILRGLGDSGHLPADKATI